MSDGWRAALGVLGGGGGQLDSSRCWGETEWRRRDGRKRSALGRSQRGKWCARRRLVRETEGRAEEEAKVRSEDEKRVEEVGRTRLKAGDADGPEALGASVRSAAAMRPRGGQRQRRWGVAEVETWERLARMGAPAYAARCSPQSQFDQPELSCCPSHRPVRPHAICMPARRKLCTADSSRHPQLQAQNRAGACLTARCVMMLGCPVSCGCRRCSRLGSGSCSRRCWGRLSCRVSMRARVL